MSFRIQEQSGGGNAQNPPPEEDAFSTGEVRCKEAVAAATHIEVTQVFCGPATQNALSTDLGPIQTTTEAHGFSTAATESSADATTALSSPQEILLSAQATGWSLRQGGGKYRVNDAGKDTPILRKFAPRWTLGPASSQQSISKEIRIEKQSAPAKSE